MNEGSFVLAANLLQADDEEGLVATGGAGGAELDVRVTGGVSSALRLGLDRRFGRGGGALMSEPTVATLGELLDSSDAMEVGLGGGTGADFPNAAD